MKIQDVVDTLWVETSRGLATVVSIVTATDTYKNLAGTVSSWWSFGRKKSETINNIAITYDNVKNAYKQSPEVRTIIYRGLLENLVWYALPVMAYERLIKPTVVDDTFLEVIDMPMQGIFYGVCVCMFVNGIAYNSAFDQALGKFVPHKKSGSVGLNKAKKPEEVEPCHCSPITRITASFASAMHYTASVASGMVLFWLPRIIRHEFGVGDRLVQIGGASSFFVRVCTYGYCLVSMKYAHHNVCAKHRYRIATNNKLYCFLIGATFLSSNWAGAYVLDVIAGTRGNFFLEDATFNPLFQFFMLFSLLKQGVLSRDNKNARDPLFLQQRYGEKIMGYGVKMLIQESGAQNAKSGLQTMNSCLDRRLTDWLASTTAISWMLLLRHKEVMSSMTEIVKCRNYPLEALTVALKPVAPEVYVALINLVKQRGWEETRNIVHSMVDKAVQMHGRERVQLENQENDEDAVDFSIDAEPLSIMSSAPMPPLELKVDEGYLVQQAEPVVAENAKIVASSLPSPLSDQSAGVQTDYFAVSNKSHDGSASENGVAALLPPPLPGQSASVRIVPPLPVFHALSLNESHGSASENKVAVSLPPLLSDQSAGEQTAPPLPVLHALGLAGLQIDYFAVSGEAHATTNTSGVLSFIQKSEDDDDVVSHAREKSQQHTTVVRRSAFR